jgi:hypothetical protein
MNQPLNQQPQFERSSFRQTCDYCGAVFEVFVSRMPEADVEADYHCPECDKRFTVVAALQPLVRLRAKRCDGKSDRYQDTMF